MPVCHGRVGREHVQDANKSYRYDKTKPASVRAFAGLVVVKNIVISMGVHRTPFIAFISELQSQS